eukprot:TRINITY_DN80350_c0_g1_i1.p1 TRINITY_DN80350_c0_g1~~TRINITY_DN80350_c0_g1_i1.p1  ORF type:complete len:420 (-),score=89.37 TRINITY_DN80350_c0_g1_i1:101-1360(-)
MTNLPALLTQGSAQHAPLSNEQTLAIATQLHQICQENRTQIEDLRQYVRGNMEGVGGNKNRFEILDGQVRNVDQGVNELRSSVLTLSQQVELNTERNVKLRELTTEAHAGVDGLRSGLKVTNSNAHTIHEEAKLNTARIEELRRDVDRVVQQSLSDLVTTMQKVLMRLDNLELNQGKARTTRTNQAERITSLEAHASATREAIGRFDESLVAQGKDVAGVVNKMETNMSNLEMTNAVVMKLHEEIEATRADGSLLKGDHRALNARHDRLHQDHLRAAKETSGAVQSLERLSSTHDSTQALLNQTMGQVLQLQTNTRGTEATVQDVRRKCEVLSAALQQTQENLQATNALTLPNLKSGGMVSPAFGGSAGVTGGSLNAALSASDGFSVGSRSARGSPGKKKEAVWISRNVGLVPDRMSWM